MDIEIATKLIFRLCKNHPELCPHIYTEYETAIGNNKIKHWKCSICGRETTNAKDVLDSIDN